MIWKHNGEIIPLEVYHGVPSGWLAEEITNTHQELDGTFDISVPEVTEPGAPSWFPDRYNWLQYREILFRVADGVRAKDKACIEIAIRYIELRYIGSYSGYIRARLSRSLKSALLSEDQKQRLKGHFLGLLKSGEHTVDFREYFKLWRSLLTEEEKVDLINELGNGKPETKHWLARKLQPNNGMQSDLEPATRALGR